MTLALVRAIPALVLIALLNLGLPARAQDAAPLEVGRWRVYGTTIELAQDRAVPGEGVLRVAALSVPGEDWTSAANVPIAPALNAGDQISGIFWARADRPTQVPVTLQAGTAPYAGFASTRVDLTPAWQRFVITGTAPSNLAAGSQLLSVQLGKATADVSLGPVLLLPGTPDPARIDAAFAAFRPDGLAQDARIPSDPGVMLAGTLRLPRGRGPGPFPIAVTIVGSGPGGRGTYALLSDRLLADGIATLEYDKRGTGQSTGAFLDTIPLMERDAAAAISWLRTRSDIDPNRIALVGMSQGGVVAPAVASRDPAIAAIVMLAGPVGPRGQLFLSEMQARLSASGMSEAVIERITTATGLLMEAHLRGAQPSEIAPLRGAVVQAFTAGSFTAAQADGATATLEMPHVLSMYDVGPDQALARIRAPVLVLYAGMDTVVATPRNLPAARAALRDNQDATVIEMPGLNHVFQRAQASNTEEFTRLGVPLSGPGVVELVGTWLEARLHPPARAVP